MRWALALIAIVLTWALFQAQPFVPSVWRHPLWEEAAATLGRSVYGSISVVPEDSFKGISRLITYIAGGLLGFSLAQGVERGVSVSHVLTAGNSCDVDVADHRATDADSSGVPPDSISCTLR